MASGRPLMLIDTALACERQDHSPLRGGVHDLNVTPDGKYVIVGNSRGAKTAGKCDERS